MTRADGTSTTWEANRPELTNRWTRKQKQKRARLAAQDSFVDLAPYGLDIVNTDTVLRSRAFEEKLRLRNQDADYRGTEGWDAVDDETQELSPTIEGTYADASCNSSPSSSRARVDVSRGSSPSSSVSAPKRRLVRPLPRRIVNSTSEESVSTYPRRRALANKWTKVAKSSGAASISIVNDVDNDELPAFMSSFQYLEKGYL